MIDLNLLTNIEIKNLINYRTGYILEESETGVFVKEKLSGDCHLNNTNIEEGIKWLDKHANKDCNFMCLYQKEYYDYLIHEYNFKELFIVKLVAYLKKDYPVVDKRYSLRTATINDFQLIIDNYHYYSDEDVKRLIDLEKIFLLDVDGETVGMIGEHFAGSMGLLQVFEKYRRKGYGTILEKLNIIRILKKGRIPCAEVVVDNENSFKIQEKIGLTISDSVVYCVIKK